MIFPALLVVLILFPTNLYAQVMIDEIAWMGTSASTANEWIELANTGSEAIDMTGWTLEAGDGTPKIMLTGSIAAGGFFLLERTDDATVSDVPADQIYTGALGNSGEVLTLKDAGGAVIDSVDAGAGWPAGDNTTKQTMQRAGPPAGGGWITEVPTPRAVNASPPPPPANEPSPPPAPTPVAEPPPRPPQPSMAPPSPQIPNQPPEPTPLVSPQITPPSSQVPAPLPQTAPAPAPQAQIQKNSPAQNSPLASLDPQKQSTKTKLAKTEDRVPVPIRRGASILDADTNQYPYRWLFGSIAVGLFLGIAGVFLGRRFYSPL